MTGLKRINYPALGEVKTPYVHAVKQDKIFYIYRLMTFGSVAQKGTLAEQAEVIFQQIHKIAEAENITLSALIKVTIFITSFEDIDALRTVLFHYYGDNLPASSLVEVSRLFSPDLKIEIEAIMTL